MSRSMWEAAAKAYAESCLGHEPADSSKVDLMVPPDRVALRWLIFGSGFVWGAIAASLVSWLT